MLETTRILNEQIAQAAFDLLPPGWATAALKVKMLTGYTEMRAEYLPKGGSEKGYFDVNFNLNNLFEQLRASMYEDVGAAWYVATLALTANGSFNFQFDYEDTSQFRLKPTAEELERDLHRFPRGSRGSDTAP